MPLSRLGCPLSLRTPNMGNTGLFATWPGHNLNFFNRPFAPPLTHGTFMRNAI